MATRRAVTPKQHRVINPERPRRNAFEGSEAAARLHIERNFPRPGGVDGEHQAHLLLPDGTIEVYTAPDSDGIGGWSKYEPPVEAVDDEDDDDSSFNDSEVS